ncbi:MAG: carbohydrate kinase [Gammaproteobacteria bacterium]|nr:MAG: carbohydrate kinase [Gammaproteobacteria bacterium]
MKSIVCFGEALIDFLASPERAADGTPMFLQHAGGAPANVAVAVAHLDGRSEFVGMLGADLFGDYLLEELKAISVGTHYIVRTDAAKTALAFVALDAHGERSFSFYRPPAADLLFRPAHFRSECFAQAGIFHVCSNSLTEAEIAQATLDGMARARAAGALVSIDLNLRLPLWPREVDPLPRLWQALRAADLVKLAANELHYLAERDAGERAVLDELLKTAQVVVVTDGDAAVRWHTRTGEGSLPAFAVRAVDTTAAGDAFVGGMLVQLIERKVTIARFEALLRDTTTWTQVLRFAAACGALTVTRHGAFAAMPTRAEVEALLAQDQPQRASA